MRSASPAFLRCVSVADSSAASCSASARRAASALSRLGSLAELEHQLATCRAERLVDAGQHAAEPIGSIRREQAYPLGVSARAELLQRALERLAAENRRTGVLELTKARIETSSERMGTQEPVAEAVDGRDPGAVELSREIGAAALAESGTNTAAKLARRLACVRDDQDRLDVDSALAYRTDVALDEDRGLSRSRAGRHEHRAVGFDGGELLVVEPCRHLDDGHGLATRHIGQRSHHDGHPSPFGSWRTSPARIRSALSAARPRADSTWLQNVSSSR